MKKMTTTIDNFPSYGKSTMAKGLVKEIGYTHIDSGATYCAVILYSIKNGIFNGDAIGTEKLKQCIGDIHISLRTDPETGRLNTYLNGVSVEGKVRAMEVSSRVSPISALGFTHEAMVVQQQKTGKVKDVVMDSRDIGTTIFPGTESKIFVTASLETRAQHRYDGLKAKGQEANFEEILESVKQYDYIDQMYEVSPLKKVDNALLSDNNHLTIVEQKEWLTIEHQKAIKE